MVLDVEARGEELAPLFEEVEEFSSASDAVLTGKLRLQRVGDGVRVAGHVNTTVAFECGRCLEQRSLEVSAELEYMLVSRAEWEAGERRGALSGDGDGEDDEVGMALTAHDLDMHYYEGEEIAILPLIREALLLELPPFNVCPPEQEAACDAAYQRNVGQEALEKNEEGAVDPRWAALLELKKKKENN